MPLSEPPAAKVAKPMLAGPKRQHFLPRFYLENFSNDGLVSVYDRESDEVRRQQPVNTGVIGHFYTMEDDQGRRRFELEQLLGEYEGKSKPVIDKLAAREEINEDERSDLAIFVAFAAMRTPDVVDSLKAFNNGLITKIMKSMYSDADEVAARLRDDSEYADKSQEALLDEARSMVELAQTGALEVTTQHRWAVGMAIKMAFEVAPIFAGRDWVVLHRDNERKSFITTDAPVRLTTTAKRESNFWGVGYGNADAVVFFPLKASCTLALLGESGDFRHMEIGTEKIRDLNMAMASKCQRFLIGRDDALVRSLAAATGLATTEWQPKMRQS